MKYSYYPGCSAHATGIEIDASTRRLCQLLDIELNEIPDWSCCGASSAHTVDEALAAKLGARNLALAEKMGEDNIVTPCPACFNRLKTARHNLLGGHAPKDAEKIAGKVDVEHIQHLFSRKEVIEKMREKAPQGLKGMKVVTYYGCLTSRPPEITGAERPEDPKEMDDLMRACGAEVIDWPLKTQCCGGSLTLTKQEIVQTLCSNLFEMAKRYGAEAIVSNCQMCFMNLDQTWTQLHEKGETENLLPIFYFTELMLLALDPTTANNLIKKHLSDSQPILNEKGF